MRLALIATFAAMLAAILPARAQDAAAPCKFYEDLIAAAPSNFEPYRAKEQAPGFYAAKLRPAQFPTCAIIAQAETALLCYGPLAPETVLRLVYNAELGRMRTCLTGWNAKPPLPTDEPQIELVDGVRYIRETPAGVLTLGLAMGRETTGARRHRLGFAILWQPLRTGA